MFSERDSILILILNFLSQAKSYDDRKEEVTQMLRKLQDYFIEVNFINSETERFDAQRDSFFEKINLDLEVLLQAECLSAYHLKIDFNTIKIQCLDSLKTKINGLLTKTERLVNKLVKNEQFYGNEYDKLNKHYSNLVSIKKHIKLANKVRI